MSSFGLGDNWNSTKTSKAPVKSSSQTNQDLTVCRPNALPVAEPTLSEHWREKVSHLTDLHLLTLSLIGGLPILSLTIKGYWLPWQESCQAYLQPSDVSTPVQEAVRGEENRVSDETVYSCVDAAYA